MNTYSNELNDGKCFKKYLMARQKIVWYGRNKNLSSFELEEFVEDVVCKLVSAGYGEDLATGNLPYFWKLVAFQIWCDFLIKKRMQFEIDLDVIEKMRWLKHSTRQALDTLDRLAHGSMLDTETSYGNVSFPTAITLNEVKEMLTTIFSKYPLLAKAIELRFLSELSQEETAQILGTTVHGVSHRVRTGRKILRERLAHRAERSNLSDF